MINWVFWEGPGGAQSAPEGRPGVRNVCCNLYVQWVCLLHPPLVGNALAWRAGEPRKVLELQALFGWLIGKRGLKLLSPRLQVKDFHLAVLVQQRLFYLCVSKPLKILLGHISGELIETLK